jgi:hypothetical protein
VRKEDVRGPGEKAVRFTPYWLGGLFFVAIVLAAAMDKLLLVLGLVGIWIVAAIILERQSRTRFRVRTFARSKLRFSGTGPQIVKAKANESVDDKKVENLL